MGRPPWAQSSVTQKTNMFSNSHAPAADSTAASATATHWRTDMAGLPGDQRLAWAQVLKPKSE
ncbi:hypothetical protein GmRootV59_56140 (plasmid) [Variovorax sp. V59]